MQAPIMVLSKSPPRPRRHHKRLDARHMNPGGWLSRVLARGSAHCAFDPSVPAADTNTKRETGRVAQLGNIAAAKARR